MEAIKLEGIVYKLGETKEVGEKNFRVREMILEVEPESQYPIYATIQGAGDKCDKMDDMAPGSTVTVHVNLRGRLYKDKSGIEKSFNSFDIWKFEVNSSVPVDKPAKVDIQTPDPAEDDDMPF